MPLGKNVLSKLVVKERRSECADKTVERHFHKNVPVKEQAEIEDHYQLNHRRCFHRQGSMSGCECLMKAMIKDDSWKKSPDKTERTSNSPTPRRSIYSRALSGSGGDGVDPSIKNEAVRNIIDDNQSWDKIKQRLQSQGGVTSIHVSQVCGSLVMEKAEKIKEERKAKQSTVRKLRILFKAYMQV